MIKRIAFFLLFILFIPCAAFAATPDTVSVICIDAASSKVLYEEHADVQRPPASMIKLMMMLLVAEGLEKGDWTLDQTLTVSPHAQSMGGTQVYLAAGETWSLHKLVYALAVASANDAAMTIAEGLWGSEEAYLKRMNERAGELGMVNSKFNSVHGLPPSPGEEGDVTTARDMLLLAQQCIKHPRILEWTHCKQFQMRPEQNYFNNTNKLLWRMEDCDGLKTGYIRLSGYCITATAERNGHRLIAVVMGERNRYQRFNRAQALLEEGFAALQPPENDTTGVATDGAVASAATPQAAVSGEPSPHLATN